jgi:chromosome segregation ATPase
MTNTKNKIPSNLVQAVTTLDNQFSELSRLSIRIESAEMRSEADVERIKTLMNHFTESALGISNGVIALSTALNEAREQAEVAAQMVSARADQLQAYQAERQKKWDAFRALAEKVQTVSTSLAELKKPEGAEHSPEDRAKITQHLSELEGQLHPLIEEAQLIKADAQEAQMTDLEQEAHSLKQSLMSVSKKIAPLQPTL